MNRVTDIPPPTRVDALLMLLVAAVLGLTLYLVWYAAAGRFAAEPSPTTWVSGDGDRVQVTP